MKSVLLLEDESALLAMYTTFLECFGYKVCGAENVAEATKLWAATKSDFDLIVSDCDTGIENEWYDFLLEVVNIRNIDTPLIFMSGREGIGDDSFENKAKKLGAIASMMKPFTPSDLKNHCENALGAQMATSV